MNNSLIKCVNVDNPHFNSFIWHCFWLLLLDSVTLFSSTITNSTLFLHPYTSFSCLPLSFLSLLHSNNRCHSLQLCCFVKTRISLYCLSVQLDRARAWFRADTFAHTADFPFCLFLSLKQTHTFFCGWRAAGRRVGCRGVPSDPSGAGHLENGGRVEITSWKTERQTGRGQEDKVFPPRWWNGTFQPVSAFGGERDVNTAPGKLTRTIQLMVWYSGLYGNMMRSAKKYTKTLSCSDFVLGIFL